MFRVGRKAAASAAIILSVEVGQISAFAQMPDNSNQNRSQANQSLSADQQGSSKSDREITTKFRKAIIAEKDLSTYAHNIKIITVNGAVTLKGPVKSEDEKTKIAAIAGNVVSPDKITNELSVK